MDIALLTTIGQPVVLRPYYSMKAFSLTSFQIISSGITSNRSVDFRYRYSFTSRSWKPWEPLTQANINTLKIDPLSFFYIEIEATRTGTDTTGSITLSDIVFTGKFQNIAQNYKNTTKFGFRNDCDYGNLQCAGEIDNINLFVPTCTPSFRPYETIRTVSFYNIMANQVNSLFGWEVDYYRVTPDSSAVDHVLHEFGLFNYTTKAKIKIMVPKNKFPENTIQFNQYDLGFFDSFEVHMVRDEFHRVFGSETRPAEQDRIFFCQMNRLYKVEHAQGFREFMNASVYYKMVLTKAQDDETIGQLDEMQGLRSLIESNSHDTLIGGEIQEEKQSIALKPENDNLTEDRIREELFAPISPYDLANGDNIIARSYYNLSVASGTAIRYLANDLVVTEGVNRTFSAWFELTGASTSYNFITNTSGGYSISLVNNELVCNFGAVYRFPVSLDLNVWYGIVVNVHQRQRSIEYAIYKRTTPSNHTTLITVKAGRLDMTPYAWSSTTADLCITASPMHCTNIRLFDDYIPATKHFILLNQYVVKDKSKIILSDSANRKVVTASHRY